MANIRKYIRDHLLDPLRDYPTIIQETLLELITEKLETLYDYTILFPEIVTPNTTRLEILKVIADQFLFTIRDEADLQEQIDILTNILAVYNKRGSIDTIENMWKYYGGDLPRDVQVIIPSYNLFRYSISPFSGIHVFQDGDTNRTGLYEIKLTNSTYPIPKLKEFLLKELVAAGNYIYFTNAISAEIGKDTSESYYKYDIIKDHFLNIQMKVAPSYQGLTLSGPNSFLSGSYKYNTSAYRRSLLKSYNTLNSPDLSSVWSGKENIFVELSKTFDNFIAYDYIPDDLGYFINLFHCIPIEYMYDTSRLEYNMYLHQEVYCTPSDEMIFMTHDLYNNEGDQIIYNEYFIIGETLLGDPLGYSVKEKV